MDITRSHSSPVEDGSSSASRSYALGYSDGEFRRLEMQSQLFGDLTEDVLRRAGLSRGACASSMWVAALAMSR